MPKPLWLEKHIAKLKAQKNRRLRANLVTEKEYFDQKCRWATDKEVAKKLGVTRETLYRYRKKYHLPCFRLKFNRPDGSPFYRLRYDLNDVEKWLQWRAYRANNPKYEQEFDQWMNGEINSEMGDDVEE